MHHLLRRQLKKLNYHANVIEEKNLTKFLEVIDQAYKDADDDRNLLENMLQISSSEMQGLYEKLKQQSAKELAHSEKKYWNLVKNIENHYFFYTYGTDEKISYISDSVKDILGYEKDEFIDGLDLHFIHNEFNYNARSFAKLSKQGFKQEPYQCSVLAKNNTLRYLEVTEIPIFDNSGNIESIEGIVRDITRQHETQQKIVQISLQDDLTRLCNRKCFNEKLDALISFSKQRDYMFAVLFLDLDSFKYINDTLGHNVGDLLLKKVGKRLNSLIVKKDILARVGGDEFVLVFNNINEKSLYSVVNNVLSLFKDEWYIDKHKLTVTTSIGISIFPKDGKTRDSLMKNADIAMYNSKKLGRNTSSFYRKTL